MRRSLASTALALALAACSETPQADHQAEWRDVLARKKAAMAPDATPRQKQVYADALAAFVQRHPSHGRGHEVYQRVQVEFADELVAFGRYQDAVGFYRAVLARNPHNEQARRGLVVALDRLAITRDKLLQLEKGMTRKDVAQVLGKPIPGWTNRTERPGPDIEAWYYRTTTGSIAGVYFRDGKVFAAEENSDAKLGL
jgi:hypothetical protein